MMMKRIENYTILVKGGVFSEKRRVLQNNEDKHG